MNKETINYYIKAGRIAKEVKEFARGIIKAGMPLLEIAEKIDEKIKELGASPAFPVNLSLNEIAAHFTPSQKDNIVASGLLKVDIGVTVEGFIADTAFTLDLTPEKKFNELISLNEKILKNISKSITPGMEINQIGEIAQSTLEDYNEINKTNYRIIKSLSGHELGRNLIHTGLTIPNYKNSKTKTLKNIAIAVEPFLTSGAGDVYEGAPGGIFILKSETQARDPDTRKLLNFIKDKYATLPFCLRWLEKENFKKLNFSLSLLKKQNIIYEYPMLIEKSKAPVSQAENTFLILDNQVIITT